MLKAVLVWVAAFALTACSYVSEGDPWSVAESEVLSVSEALPPCGILYTLVEVKLRDQRNKTQVIYLPCVEVIEGPLPKPGESCSATGKMEYVDGSVASGSISQIKPVRLTHELTCDGETYVFRE